MDLDKTMYFKMDKDENANTKQILKEVAKALKDQGYNPISQLVGYILSGDPTYITSYNNARAKIRQIEIDELLETILNEYIGIDKNE